MVIKYRFLLTCTHIGKFSFYGNGVKVYNENSIKI